MADVSGNLRHWASAIDSPHAGKLTLQEAANMSGAYLPDDLRSAADEIEKLRHELRRIHSICYFADSNEAMPGALNQIQTITWNYRVVDDPVHANP